MKRQLIFLSIFFSCIFLCKDLIAQTKKITVTGTVIDAVTKETIIGANIYVGAGDKPQGVGSTDARGRFSISVNDGSLLTFAYVSYVTKKVQLKPGQTTVNVTLSEDKKVMDEVVIRGYQKRSREVTTGSSFIVTGKEVQDAPVSNIEQLLQGKVAGLNVQINTGAPGMRGSVNIRGLSTLNVTGAGNESFLQPTSPLYVIDGVPMDADKASEFGFQQQGPGVSPLSLIPQEDIASIEILKDATATSLYGSRGAYGVILIQTIRGNSEVPRIRYTTNFFMRSIPKLRETLGGSLERQTKLYQIENFGRFQDLYGISNTPFLADSLNGYFNNSTNWQGVFYQNTYNQSHNLALDGGNEKFNYKTNVGYYGESGVIKNTGFDRYSLNMNMEFKPSTRLRFFGAMFGSLAKIQKGNGVGLLQTGVASNGQNSSLLPGPSFFQATSSVLSSLTTKSDAGPKNIRANVEGNYELFPNLNVTVTGSYDYNIDTEDTFTPAAANSQFAKIYSYYGYTSNLYNRNNISYSKSLGEGEAHNFFVSVFSEMYIRAGQSSITQLERSPNDQFQGPLGYDGFFSKGGGVLESFLDQRTASFAAAFNYSYKKKYILDVTYRIDGDSNSGSSDPYAKNPSIGLKWNFNKEGIFENSKWLTFGAIRATAGKNIYPNGSLTDIYGRYNPNSFYNNYPRVGIDYRQIPNPLLKPTTVLQYNFGLDLGLFDGKLDVIFDTYFKDVDNLLFSNILSNTLGFNEYKSNDAGVANYGYELALSSRPLSKTSDWNWNITVNGAINKDVLTQLPAEYNGQFIKFDGTSGLNQHIVQRVGRNSLSNFLYLNQGVYKSTADVPIDPVTGLRYRNNSAGSQLNSFQGGDPIIYDANGDYILDSRDMQVSGNSQPLITGGLSNTVGYKNFSLNIYASFTAKRSVLNNALAERLRLMANPFGIDGGVAGRKPLAVVPLDDLSMWRQTGDNAVYANAYDYAHNQFTNPFRYEQTLWQEEGSYLKINQITLSYQFDKKLAKRVGLNNIRTFLSSSNIATFSKYSGPNPEGVTALGRDGSNGYPVPRTYNFGFNIEL
ncbi:SusC/RagA family TonB-linked outer membrane protein [Pedobacter psychroterrae]|uniref:SusC/RagA family TonB-linked outer membrane protein n=1 Tax=Pedobacter psychroterrae TaxID=2530453 RepID=A0A4R0NN14_9SPHI|nr:SusC/RagA family TonB-linked outer membrane protein [Pedobacter psychroterrae]TCD01328.1 SusC/RagA family TonB-linked outer membrane protein [Pedobacter psychroterrae]